MRMSCNGCRVLRKGCSDNCSIRPCLEWIKSPDSQANATVFLAKFYGRAGLINLINAGAPHLRPAIFRSLLYEACGRIVNPIHGSVGLMWSGSWQLCHTAVEAILRGAPILQMTMTDAAEAKNGPPFMKAYDIRHVNKEHNLSACSNDLHRVRNRRRFKRSKRARSVGSAAESGRDGSPSHESSLSHQSEAAAEADPNLDCESRGRESAKAEHESEARLDSVRRKYVDDKQAGDDGEIELELTLGMGPLRTRDSPCERGFGSAAAGVGFCKMELRLDCPAS